MAILEFNILRKPLTVFSMQILTQYKGEFIPQTINMDTLEMIALAFSTTSKYVCLLSFSYM